MLYYNALVDSDNPLGYAAGRDCVLEDDGRWKRSSRASVCFMCWEAHSFVAILRGSPSFG